jgi:FAD/FMN-containing dehydrogenase
MENQDTYLNQIKELLENKIAGEINFDNLHKILYSTDASDYSDKPFGVIYPKNQQDIQIIIEIANKYKIPLIPRGGGTSLAGQVVGKGLVIDVSKHLNKILEINVKEKWVRVEPGVIPDVLNMELRNYDLFWGPETSTSNRNTLGGMLGNNSCGSHFPLYGNTREHILEVKGFFANGTPFFFKPLLKDDFLNILKSDTPESKIYNFFYNTLQNKEFRKEIIDNFPKSSIRRRNSGYAVDALLDTDVFQDNFKPFNLSKLIAGSEGTLVFVTELKLDLVSAPPKNVAVILAHFNDLIEALKANVEIMKFQPGAVELIDNQVLELTKTNPIQRKNRAIISGEPTAVLVIEFAHHNNDDLNSILQNVINMLEEKNLGYDYPIIRGSQINQIWELRKAGLGVLSNITSDERSVTVIEDTAVDIADLPDYASELISRMKELDIQLISYAHVATGEIHFHPILNLKTKEGVENYRKVLIETAKIVKKYRGSLCGEHGDGRLRGEMIPFMFGENIYNYFKSIKNIFDPENILNPGKIIDAPAMNTNLRFDYSKVFPTIDTYFDYSNDNGFEHAVERCNGSGDCRRPQILGGTMCPSYKATLNEKDSTRARANALREILLNSCKGNPFDSEELLEVFSLCLSCKACKNECPSNVDITKLKAEFLQHYFDANGIPLPSFLIGYFPKLQKIASFFPAVYNFIISNPISANLIKKVLNFDQRRELPKLNNTTLTKFFSKNNKQQFQTLLTEQEEEYKQVYLFNDEFTNYVDSEIGIKSILLLTKLGYHVKITKNLESGRTYLSKGLLKRAKKIAEKNIEKLSRIINQDAPLIGLEPSAILTLRDEYIELVNHNLKEKAKEIANHTFLIDEFIAREIDAGKIKQEQFSDKKLKIKFHTHCHQKSLASSDTLFKMLKVLKNADISEIPSGCCGMAGSFGFEKEKYDLSMKIGELVLFPTIRESDEDTIIIASGTSCRHQIKDGTGRIAMHPVELLFNFLKLN